jgi:myo-inositol 2-dehydrogenase / D-chiro-inositol 1-dehydrogenase
MKMKKLKVGLVGCGDIAQTGHLPALLSHPGVEVVGLCDVRKQRLELLGTMAPGVLKTSDYRDLVKAGCEAFVLALHPEVSVGVACDLLGRGLHVLDEKPLAVSLADAARLGEAVTASKAVYQIGFVFRYAGFVRDVAAGIRQVGYPNLVRVDVFDERLDEANEEHLGRIMGILKKSSAVTHEGSHVVDYSRVWNDGRFVKVGAEALTTDKRFEGSNVWALNLTHEDGSVLQVNIGWLLPVLPENKVVAVGPQGRFEAPFAGPVGVFTGAEGRKELSVAGFAQDWRAQLDVFLKGIQAGRCLGTGFEDGLRALEVTVGCENKGLERG